MAIEFVVEDGTGKSDATSYASVAEYRQYWLNRGTDYTSIADETIQSYLNSATEYVDISYNFIGESANSGQALEWPRFGATDRFGEEIASDIVPQKVKDSACYMGAQISTGANQVDEGLSSVSYGKVSKTFSRGGIKKYPVANKLLKQLIASGNKLIRVH